MSRHLEPGNTIPDFELPDEDGRGLYVTALTSIYHTRVDVPGIRP